MWEVPTISNSALGIQHLAMVTTCSRLFSARDALLTPNHHSRILGQVPFSHWRLDGFADWLEFDMF